MFMINVTVSHQGAFQMGFFWELSCDPSLLVLSFIYLFIYFFLQGFNIFGKQLVALANVTQTGGITALFMAGK